MATGKAMAVQVNDPKSAEVWTPSDGGLRSWLVVLASFITSGLIFGVINSFSVIYVELLRTYEENGVIDASFKTSLVGSLTFGVVFLVSPVAGILSDRVGPHVTAMIGGALASVGMLVSSWLVPWVEALYFSYAIVFGVGASLACTPSLAALGFHFRTRLGLVNGLATSGGSMFAVFLPPAIEAMIPRVGLEGVFRILSLFMTLIIGCAYFFQMPAEVVRQRKLDKNNRKSTLGSLINRDNWRRRKYVIWCLALPVAYFGYFVPFVHIVKYVNINFPEQDGKIFIMCIGLATAVSRISFGLISDLRFVDRILMQQVSFLTSGTLIMLLSITGQWELVVLVVVFIGLFDGGFISLLGAIAFDLCGLDGGSQAIGFILGAVSIPLAIGPPIAGLIFDHTQSYYIPFLMAGASPILAGLIMIAMRCVPHEQYEPNSEQGLRMNSIVKSRSAVPLTGYRDVDL